MTEAHDKLQLLRSQIDLIDEQLVTLLNQRATLSIEIGSVKKSDPVCAIEIKDNLREKNILLKITEQNAGPLSNNQLTELFESIMSQSCDLQRAI